MDLERIMRLKSPYIMYLGRYRHQKSPTNFSEEAYFSSQPTHQYFFVFIAQARALHAHFTFGQGIEYKAAIQGLQRTYAWRFGIFTIVTDVAVILKNLLAGSRYIGNNK